MSNEAEMENENEEEPIVIFVDIDGVMLPVRSYFNGHYNGVPSHLVKADLLGVNILKHLCNRFKANLVFNSVWSGNPVVLYHWIFTNGMEYNTYGITEEREFGPRILPPSNAFYTEYPRVSPRLEAIHKWIALNMDRDFKWIAFDDDPGEELMDSGRCILVNPEIGITPSNYREATELLVSPDPFVVLM